MKSRSPNLVFSKVCTVELSSTPTIDTRSQNPPGSWTYSVLPSFTQTFKDIFEQFLPASPKAKAGLGVQSLSSQLLWNYWSNYHETWYVDKTSYVVMHIGRKFWSPHFCGSYVPWNFCSKVLCKKWNHIVVWGEV